MEIPSLQILTSEIPPAIYGEKFRFQLAASGGQPPFTWSNTGHLVKGLKLTDAGILTGTFLTPKLSEKTAETTTNKFSVRSNDGQIISKEMEVSGRWLVDAPTLRELTPTLPNALSGAPYTAALGIIGAHPIKIISEKMPSGISLDTKNGNPTVINGYAPTVSKHTKFHLGLELQDAVGQTLTVKRDLPVLRQDAKYQPPKLVLKSSSFPSAAIGEEYSVYLAAEGGYPPYYYHVSGDLPPGLSLDTSQGLITGIPEQEIVTELRFQVIDTANGEATKNIPIVVKSFGYPLPEWMLAFSGVGAGISLILVISLLVMIKTVLVAPPSRNPYARKARESGQMALLITTIVTAAMWGAATFTSSLWGDEMWFRMLMNTFAVLAFAILPVIVLQVLIALKGIYIAELR